MKLLVGLGNPGSQFEKTRHNVGFRIVDALAARLGWKWERKGRAMIASGTIGSEKVTLAKPITFMNLSGEAVGELVRWFKIEPKDVLVIYDELDLPVGQVRLRLNGSAGGHHGMENIIRHLHSSDFPRLRIGIGRPRHDNYVLSVPPTEERIQLEIGEGKAVEVLPLIVQQGVNLAMNTINTDPEAQKKAEERRRQQQERRAQERQRREAEKKQAAATAEGEAQSTET